MVEKLMKYEIKDDKLDESYFYVASNKDEAIKKFYSKFLTKFFKKEYHEIRTGIITTKKETESYFYTFHLSPECGLRVTYKDLSKIKYHGGLFKKDETIGRKLLHGAWIPSLILTNVSSPKIKEITSIFDVKMSGQTYKTFMFNSNTKQLLLGNEFSSRILYDKYAVEKDKNPYNDFVIGNINEGEIVLNEDLSEVMKIKDTSDMVVKTLNMFKMNGAKDNYVLSNNFSEKTYKLGYFLKTKVLW